ncbi:MAG: hypothetical protein ACK5EZ_09350 [Bacteroidota bacterium]|nr:hypothetical protein [Chitinophagaceae bacterium]
MRLARLFLPLLLFSCFFANAQVSNVEYGRNRVQYKKINWTYYQTRNFNTYYYEGGNQLAKFTAQVAEEELNNIEEFIEYGLQRRANIAIYNSFTDYRQSNIGLGIDWQNTGGVTKLVNNKIILFYDGNLNHLRISIRQGIAKVLVENLLFGDDLGEFAGNQALLDLPKWLTDGYISYVGEEWSPALDDKLKSALLSGKYKTFYQFAFRDPIFSGHAFWKFIADQYKKESVTYFLYLSRIYKSLNTASLKVTKKRFKDLLKEFMEKESDKYLSDLKGRRNQPRGNVVAIETVKARQDFYRFQANPIARNNTYAMVEYKKGIYKVIFEDLSEKRKILLKAGILNYQDELNPHYPLLAWDSKGSRLSVIYNEEGKIKLFVYDAVSRYKAVKQVVEDFQIIQDAKFMLDNNTLVLSAVKNGQSDIFVYKIAEQTVEQITNDVYDDLDASFVAFPNKTGIIFSSNRPTAKAVRADTAIASRNSFNVFLVDNWTKSEFRQITQLTNQKYGQARFPLQYNVNHFTFVSDANGIGNRYAGFFSTKKEGLDTIYKVGDEYLRNPPSKELDSTLRAFKKSVPDSIGYISISNDSTYVFPLTNYESSLQESRGAGDNNLVSEVRQEGDMKFLYKLKVNDAVLLRRNINARPTVYIKKLMDDERKLQNIILQQKTIQEKKSEDNRKVSLFQTEFAEENQSSAVKPIDDEAIASARVDYLKNAKQFDYKLKFGSDYLVSGFNNSVLVNRFQPFAGGAGPIYLSNANNLNGILRMGISDLMEDKKFIGGFRLATNLKDNDYLASYQNLKRRYDWGLTYYRSNQQYFPIYPATDIKSQLDNKLSSNLYQLNVSYPLNEVKSIRAMLGYRTDRVTILSDGNYYPSLTMSDTVLKYALVKLEYVHDNTLNPTLNIWNGLRYKIYGDVNTRMVSADKTGKYMINLGTDLRYYYPIYRNFIWAFRAAADFSWGTQKLIYYLGGVEGWLNPKFNQNIRPDPDLDYAFQTLALNLRGHRQNIANGNNNIVFNSEFRFPIFTTLLNRPINNAFLRNLQLLQFVDLGTAWNGKFDNIQRPINVYGDGTNVQVNIKTGGIGPFVGGYGFGARSTLLGYFLRVDAGWPMGNLFSGRPYWYFALGLDF